MTRRKPESSMPSERWVLDARGRYLMLQTAIGQSGHIPLLETPLHGLHVSLGGRMVPFAGWSMPLHYPTGVTAEHLRCRAAASLFDVSHMGQLSLRSDNHADDHADDDADDGADRAGVPAVLAALENLIPADLVGLAQFQQRYGLLTTPTGGIRDDCMVTRREHDVLMVVNASNALADIEYLRESLAPSIVVTQLSDQALIALQGPYAIDVLRALDPSVDGVLFMRGSGLLLDGIPCFVTRSGYTGEDGFEISVPAESAEQLARSLLASPYVNLAGLGARDTLRLEAGLCLHGHDISLATSPVEAALTWAVAKVRRPNGRRAGGYPGADVIEQQLRDGPTRLRVGLTCEERIPVREGAAMYTEDGEAIGVVTSGTVTPTLAKPIAMAYLDSRTALPGTPVFAEIRSKRIPMTVSTLPFLPTNYVRTPYVHTLTSSEQS